jgi:hypothetical protein
MILDDNKRASSSGSNFRCMMLMLVGKIMWYRWYQRHQYKSMTISAGSEKQEPYMLMAINWQTLLVVVVMVVVILLIEIWWKAFSWFLIFADRFHDLHPQRASLIVKSYRCCASSLGLCLCC